MKVVWGIVLALDLALAGFILFLGITGPGKLLHGIVVALLVLILGGYYPIKQLRGGDDDPKSSPPPESSP